MDPVQPGNRGNVGQEWKIVGLGATGPCPVLEEKLSLFGRFIGDWDITEARLINEDGAEIRQKGEIHFGWIIEGRAIQDVWMTCDQETGRAKPIVTTVRFYDPKIDAWRSTWISPVQGVVQTFVAREIGNEIVLEGKSKNGNLVKWIFSQITPGSFRWHAEETNDGGNTWKVTEEMRVERRTPK